MKYLVTGATGLLGNNIVRLLVAAGEDVRVLARDKSDPRPLEGLPVERASGDVRDAAAVAAACQGVGAVIHSAGHVHLGWSQRDVHEQINVEGTRNVAAAARSAGATLVHVSSVNALGLGQLTQPANEEANLPGIVEIPYVITKRAAERIVLDEVGRGLWAAIVHPGLLLGPWDWKPSSGKMFLAVARFAPWAPTGAVSFCDARDVAAGAIAAAARGTSGRRYILCGHNLTYKQGWQEMALVAGRPGPLLPMGPLFRAAVLPFLGVWNSLARQESDANSAALAMGCQQHCFSSDRAVQELGYNIRPLRETLEDTWRWFCDHGYVRGKAGAASYQPMIDVSEHPEGAVLAVRARPGSRKNCLRGEQNGALKVAVTQVAEKGKANEAVADVIVERLGLKRSQIELLAGPAKRDKRFLIRGVTRDELVQRIEAALTG